LIKGLVQGVGFRPLIFRLASLYRLNGMVDNRNNGVLINVEGEEESVMKFRDHIINHPPEASQIKSLEIKPSQLKGFDSFIISESSDVTSEITEISPDIAICPDCLSDLSEDQARIDYPFINCTCCGPRFSIVERLPYDRRVTSMKNYIMCDICESQYNDMLDRRFHAQPVACNKCGPVYTYSHDGIVTEGIHEILTLVTDRIMEGKTVAVKGMGGYNLLCNAIDDEAVKTLRIRKQRDAKPFAVMFRDILTLEEYCNVNPAEYRELVSWRRPILILPQLKELAPSVNSGLKTVGAMLPYMPFHYMLFSRINLPAIVFTSGNVSDEPLIKDDHEAHVYLLPIAGALLSYNREIVNRADDSVLRIISDKVSLVRRSRGFVPSPVDLGCEVEGILALGGEQKNTFCMGRGKQALISQHIGDLKNLPTYEFLLESIEKFSNLFRFTPQIVACDLHPDYLSSVHAERLKDELGIPLVRVQHHHAHIASCMAEHLIEEKVIGISLDGTGYGSDGNIWGGEFLIAGLKDFSRYSHFDYVPLPGGDKAANEPWRIAYSYLYKYFGDKIDYLSLPCFKEPGIEKILLLKEMLDKEINSPLSSGSGRLFDAVSSILGLCTVSAFDSEAPMRLESVAASGVEDYYPYEVNRKVLFAKTLEAILIEKENESIPVISAKFHNTLAMAITSVSEIMRSETAINRVVLSGGVFQNKYLFEKLNDLLQNRNFEVYTNHKVPVNDGGISLGQLIVASKII
jgi:hydrogenase maturation protein HypF